MPKNNDLNAKSDYPFALKARALVACGADAAGCASTDGEAARQNGFILAFPS
jgi:hypothetical protein